MEELTQGQAMTLVRNEQVIDRSAEEAEDLEEKLNESIADSLRGAKQKASGQGSEKKQKKRRVLPAAPCSTQCVLSISAECADSDLTLAYLSKLL